MSKKKKTLEDYKTIEAWMLDQPDEDFPEYVDANGESSFKERYKDLKTKLNPLYKIVEKGAMISEHNAWRDEIKHEIRKLKKIKDKSDSEITNQIDRLEALMEKSDMIYLNCHGTPHVKKVMERVYEILKKFDWNDMLSSYECFLLLCAIHLHDVGNVFGRDGHEHNFRHVFKPGQHPITDSPTRIFVEKIAQVHSGSIQNDKDMFYRYDVQAESNLCCEIVREGLLAALLRFADELADDFSRADIYGINLDIVSAGSIVYHRYSQSLHSLIMKKNEVNKIISLHLDYHIDSEIVGKKYKKEEKYIFLLDEIHNRTKKMEQERRYCMRFLRPYFLLNEIKVKIKINNNSQNSDYRQEEIEYELSEKGYPTDNDIVIDSNHKAENVIPKLQNKGWKINVE